MDDYGTQFAGDSAEAVGTAGAVDAGFESATPAQPAEPVQQPTPSVQAPAPQPAKPPSAEAQWEPGRRGRAPYRYCDKGHRLIDPESNRDTTMRDKAPSFCVRCERGEAPKEARQRISKGTSTGTQTSAPTPGAAVVKKEWTPEELSKAAKTGDTVHGPAMMLANVVSDFAESWSSRKLPDGKEFPGFALNESVVPAAYLDANGKSAMDFMYGDEALCCALKNYAGIAGPDWISNPMALPTITVITVAFAVVQGRRHMVRAVDMRPKNMRELPQQRRDPPKEGEPKP